MTKTPMEKENEMHLTKEEFLGVFFDAKRSEEDVAQWIFDRRFEQCQHFYPSNEEYLFDRDVLCHWIRDIPQDFEERFAKVTRLLHGKIVKRHDAFLFHIKSLLYKRIKECSGKIEDQSDITPCFLMALNQFAGNMLDASVVFLRLAGYVLRTGEPMPPARVKRVMALRDDMDIEHWGIYRGILHCDNRLQPEHYAIAFRLARPYLKKEKAIDLKKNLLAMHHELKKRFVVKGLRRAVKRVLPRRFDWKKNTPEPLRRFEHAKFRVLEKSGEGGVIESNGLRLIVRVNANDPSGVLISKVKDKSVSAEVSLIQAIV